MWSVSTIITGLISFMVETAPTLGSIETTNYQKKKFARQSLDFNAKDATFSKLFPDLVTLHKEQQQKRRELGLTASGGDGINANATANSNASVSGDRKNGTSNHYTDGNGNGMQSIMAIGAGFVALLSILYAMRFL